MESIDKLIDKALNADTVTFTFKSDGKMSDVDSIRWNDGWKVGFDIAYNNKYNGKSCCDLMGENPNCNLPGWNNGFMEGIHSGESRKLTERFPGAISITYNQQIKDYEAKYK